MLNDLVEMSSETFSRILLTGRHSSRAVIYRQPLDPPNLFLLEITSGTPEK